MGLEPHAAELHERGPLERRPIGVEAGKSFADKLRSGFVARYLSGAAILDIGYRGYVEGVEPVVPQATGIELDYPGYDGRTLPFGDQTQHAVYASHCLEHIADYRNALREWHRVLRIGGFMIIAVPHQFLYEKRTALPSRWNEDHQRFYTPASLMAEIEESLAPNTYRLRHLADNDAGYDYATPPTEHAGGCYEIEMVIERIAPPDWVLEDPPPPPPPPPPPSPPPPSLARRLVQIGVVGAWIMVPPPLKRLVPRAWRSAGGQALWQEPGATSPDQAATKP